MLQSLPKNLSTVNELSTLLQVPVKTIYDWVSRKEVPYIKVGRHLRRDASHVVEFFKKKTQERASSCLRLPVTVKNNELLRSLTIQKCKPAG